MKIASHRWLRWFRIECRGNLARSFDPNFTLILTNFRVFTIQTKYHDRFSRALSSNSGTVLLEKETSLIWANSQTFIINHPRTSEGVAAVIHQPPARHGRRAPLSCRVVAVPRRDVALSWTPIAVLNT
ncbi:hypothetical protein EVAR_89765_1 [Eumeta japonica]|uniref:Uncharacterized protein n=1 Tax=Eumeta variegata TaxID=151549 RepID=A0A4C1XFM5_EUMVA|nr:hypothetical protein EVAR_89765_1 [Eumeta japonica]